jgi:hypothetical protein
VRYSYDALGRRVRKEQYAAPPRDVAKRLQALSVNASTPDVGVVNEPPVPLPKVTEFVWDGDQLAAEIQGEGSGRVDPCAPGCRPAIRQFVDDHPGVNASYAATETGSQWSWQQVSQDRPRARVIQTEQQSNGDVDTRRCWKSSGSGNWTSKPYNT